METLTVIPITPGCIPKCTKFYSLDLKNKSLRMFALCSFLNSTVAEETTESIRFQFDVTA